MSLFSQRSSSSSKYKGASTSTCRSFPPSGNKGNNHPSPSNRLNLHKSNSRKSSANKKSPLTVHSPRLSLPPPDIVLLVEDQESHEIRNVTLLSCDEARKAVYREQQRRESSLSATESRCASRQNSSANCNLVLGFKSTEVRCFKCKKQVVTNTSKSLTTAGMTSSIIICILCPFLAICVIPLIIKSHHRVIHKCPVCKVRLGTSISPSIASSTCTPSNSTSQGVAVVNAAAAAATATCSAPTAESASATATTATIETAS